MNIKEILSEAANPAQQAAIAIAMKKAGKKPKNEGVVSEKLTPDAKKNIQTALGPRTANNPMRKDSKSARTMVGLAKSNPKNVHKENSVTEADQTDTVTMDVPLLLRMMEYAREDAKTDMDLHNVAERMIQLSKDHDYLCMDNYNEITGQGEVDESNAFTNARMNAIKAGKDSFKVNGKVYKVTGDTRDEREAITDDENVTEASKKKGPKPTNPELWSRAKSAARSKFDVYPSAYANAWASKWYKSKGGGWRS